MVHAGDARGLRTRGGADTGQVGGPKRTGVPAAPGRPERAAVFRRLPVGALTPARAPPGQRGFRSDHRVGERAHVAGRDRRRRLLPVQPRPPDRRPDEHGLSGRHPPDLPARRRDDPAPAVPPELAPGRRVHGACQRPTGRLDLRSRGAARVATARRVARVRRRRVRLHAFASRPEARRAAWRARVSPNRRAAPPGPVGGGSRRGGPGREVVQDRGWDVGWSGVTGLELGDALAGPDGGWRWSVLVRAYTGPAPYGEFFRDRVASLGVGLGLAL